MTDEKLRATLAQGLAAARERTDELFRLLHPQALRDRPIPKRHRIIFYLGHFEAFDWNLVCKGVFGLESFHPAFNRLFAFGIDPVDGGDPTDQPSDWPALEEIEIYNRRVRDRVDTCLGRAALSGNGAPLSPHAQIFHVAIEHRLMHAETLAYMLHQLPLERKRAQPLRSEPATPPFQERSVEIPAGTATLGLAPDERTPFGWDNEFAAHTVEVPAFTIEAGNVTNRRYLEFVGAGGYENRSLWDDNDWAWKEAEGIRHPLFWVRRSDAWHYRTMFGEIPLPLDWPAQVSHAEASAYARWQGKVLPTEAQFHRAAFGTPTGRERNYPWGDDPPQARHGNFDFHRWTPAPVGAHPNGRSAFGVADLVGNGWEWTSTPFAPFAGFQPFPFYPGYSANFFDGKHYVMKGGSERTAAALLRRSFRNWFQPRYPYVYATFRCVEN